MCTEKNRDVVLGGACKPKRRNEGKSFASKSLFRGAFTLAEVVIVLGLVGIIAEMTIPSLISNVQEKILLTQFQQTYSTLQHAYQSAAEENGTADTWADKYAVYANLKPYLKIIADCPVGCNVAYPSPARNLRGDTTTYWLDYYELMLANGATLKFSDGVGYRGVLVDVNGNRGPNRNGYDFFTLHFSKKNGAPFLSWPYYTDDGSSWVEDDAYSCNKNSAATDGTNGYGCPYWIIKNWNMDYLHRDLSDAEWVR